MATKAPWCAVTATVEVIGGRWKPTILFHLKDQPRRFNELRRLVPGITQRMLTLQLRALEQDGVVARTVHNNVPPHVEYSFTRKGLTLGPILDAMEAWGEANRPDAAPDPATLLIQSGGGPRAAWMKMATGEPRFAHPVCLASYFRPSCSHPWRAAGQRRPGPADRCLSLSVGRRAAGRRHHAGRCPRGADVDRPPRLRLQGRARRAVRKATNAWQKAKGHQQTDKLSDGADQPAHQGSIEGTRNRRLVPAARSRGGLRRRRSRQARGLRHAAHRRQRTLLSRQRRDQPVGRHPPWLSDLPNLGWALS